MSFEDPHRTIVRQLTSTDVLSGKRGRKAVSYVGLEKPPTYSAILPDPNEDSRGQRLRGRGTSNTDGEWDLQRRGCSALLLPNGCCAAVCALPSEDMETV